MKKATTTKKETTKPVAVETELVVYKEKIKGMKAMVDSTKVVDETTAAEVSDKVKNIKLLSKAIEQKRDKTRLPAKAIVKEAEETYNPLIKECEAAERELKDKYAVWFLAEKKRQKEEEDRISAKVESGYIKPETAVAKMGEVKQVDKTIKSESGSMLTVKEVPVAVIIDEKKIPDEFWIVDEKAVKSAALARHKSRLPQIPGVVIEMRADTSSR